MEGAVARYAWMGACIGAPGGWMAQIVTADSPILTIKHFCSAPLSLAPRAGSLSRPIGGWLSDKFSGAAVTHWGTIIEVTSTVGAGIFVQQAAGHETPEKSRKIARMTHYEKVFCFVK